MDGQDRIEDQTSDRATPDNLFALIASELGASEGAPDGCTVEDYLSDLDGLDLSEAEKRELIATVWIMIDTLLRIEFGLDPTQQIWGKTLEKPGVSGGSVVNLEHSNKTTFDRVSGGVSEAAGKESS